MGPDLNGLGGTRLPTRTLGQMVSAPASEELRFASEPFPSQHQQLAVSIPDSPLAATPGVFPGVHYHLETETPQTGFTAVGLASVLTSRTELNRTPLRFRR
ncbi:hypothetical protein XENORESO_015015 [Xenotaenia resolanae]|uniref:Uncharacterized protein n=1 Tax=Xenotaenia resolanae TaxID=208358 RepID=A0ABV0WM17_9TELE